MSSRVEPVRGITGIRRHGAVMHVMQRESIKEHDGNTAKGVHRRLETQNQSHGSVT